MYSPPPRSRRHRSASPPAHEHRYPADYDDDGDGDDEGYYEFEDDYPKKHSYGYGHRNARHKHRDYDRDHDRDHGRDRGRDRDSRGAFSMDLLRTAISTLGDAVVNGRGDGQRHQQHSNDYDPQTLNLWGNKTGDQVYETLVQAAYTLGEVLGDLEHKLGIKQDGDKRSKSERKNKHREEIEDGYHHDDYTMGNADGYPHPYGETGIPVYPPSPPSGWGSNVPRSGHADEFYNYNSSQQRPYPLRRASSNPEYESPYHQYDDNGSHHSSRSKTSKSPKSSSLFSKKPKHRNRSRSPSPSKSNKDGEGHRSRKDQILTKLPGLLTRAAFVIELRDLKKQSGDRKSMAGKYAVLLMAVKIIEQLGQEYVCYCENQKKKRDLI